MFPLRASCTRVKKKRGVSAAYYIATCSCTRRAYEVVCAPFGSDEDALSWTLACFLFYGHRQFAAARGPAIGSRGGAAGGGRFRNLNSNANLPSNSPRTKNKKKTHRGKREKAEGKKEPQRKGTPGTVPHTGLRGRLHAHHIYWRRPLGAVCAPHLSAYNRFPVRATPETKDAAVYKGNSSAPGVARGRGSPQETSRRGKAATT